MKQTLSKVTLIKQASRNHIGAVRPSCFVKDKRRALLDRARRKDVARDIRDFTR